MGCTHRCVSRRRAPLRLSPLGEEENLPRKQCSPRLSCFGTPTAPSSPTGMLQGRVLAWQPSLVASTDEAPSSLRRSRYHFMPRYRAKQSALRSEPRSESDFWERVFCLAKQRACSWILFFSSSQHNVTHWWPLCLCLFVCWGKAAVSSSGSVPGSSI